MEVGHADLARLASRQPHVRRGDGRRGQAVPLPRHPPHEARHRSQTRRSDGHGQAQGSRRGVRKRSTEHANEDLYTASADITLVRVVLAHVATTRRHVKAIDVNTSFLSANLPDSFETVYIRPPQALIEFGLVAPGTVWRCVKAIYGLRISPKAWGTERDKELNKMTFTEKGVKVRLQAKQN